MKPGVGLLLEDAPAALEFARSRRREGSISGVYGTQRWHQLWQLDRSGIQIQDRCCPHWDAQCANQLRETDMAKAKAFPSDTIALKISTGGNSAGNGGDGVNMGDITSKPSIEFNPYNKASGADVDVKTGDHVNQKA